MENKEVVSVKNLTVHYGRSVALWDLTFSLPQGKSVGIVGPNGAGKSTLLQALMGISKLTSGTIRIFGQSPRSVQKKIAYVPQKTSVDWTFPVTVLDVVLMGLYGRKGFFSWIQKRDKQAAREALERVGMLEFADRQINALSGGQKQRVFLARALLQNADLYFMDEPFAGVDITTEKSIISLMDRLREEGKTLCIVHHDLTTVKSYFDWVVMLNACLVASGPVNEVFTEENLKRTYSSSACFLPEGIH